MNILDDYIDADVSYLMGLIIGRGTLSQNNDIRQVKIDFSFINEEVHGVNSTKAPQTEIQLGIDNIRERLADLLGTDIRKKLAKGCISLLIRFSQNSLSWRNILKITNGVMDYQHFEIPSVFYLEDLPFEWRREFMRGYADVAGNIRQSNCYVDGRIRVRLDVLNSPNNWRLPIQICRLLQDYLGVAVQIINWGHPNLGHGWREHQINIFVSEFLKIGFSLPYKQQLLEEFAQQDLEGHPDASVHPCPGRRNRKLHKEPDTEENNSAKLDPVMVGKHFNSYWAICKALGCEREPQGDIDQISLYEKLDDEGK